MDDKGRIKLSRKAAMEDRKAEFSDDEDGDKPASDNEDGDKPASDDSEE